MKDKKEAKNIVLSLGGSLIVPESIDSSFLLQFREVVLKLVGKGYKIAIYCGGGSTAREYIKAAEGLGCSREDMDWAGIMATRLNAELVRAVFSRYANKEVVYDPTAKVNFEKGKSIIVAAGWKPGWSTDYDSVLLAGNLGINVVVNLTNVDYVYDKDPGKNKDARALKNVTWKELKKIVGSSWKPGLNMPFDPVACAEAEKKRMKVVIINGKKLERLERFLEGRDFEGTIIE